MERTLLLRLSASAVIIALLACLHLPALRPAIVENPLATRLDQAGEERIQAGLTRALAVYAVVRGINAVISVIQESQIDVSVFGVGGSVALGQLLDPVNDLIERFSWVLLASATSLGIQLAMVKAGSWLGLEVLLSLALLVLLAGAWVPGEQGASWRSLGGRLALVALLVRFCVPVVAVGGELFFQRFLLGQYEQASFGMERLQADITPAGVPMSVAGPEMRGPLSRDGESQASPVAKEEAERSGVLAALKAFSPMEMKEKVSLVRERLDTYVENAVDLMVVFTVQTVLLPLTMLWLLVKGFNLLAGGNLPGVPRPWSRKRSHRPEN